jgi:hypothetical protein
MRALGSQECRESGGARDWYGRVLCCCSTKASFKFIFFPEIALGDLSVLTVMNSALAYVPDMQPREHLSLTILLFASYSEKYSTIADQVAAAASASSELQSQNQKAS